MLPDQNSPIAIEESAIKTTLTESDEIAIRAEANRLIASAAAKNGISIDQVPEQARQSAYTYSKNAYIAEQAKRSNPLWGELEAERAAHAQTKKTLEAVQQVRPSPVSNSRDTGPDPAIVRARMGESKWWSLTDGGRLQSVGIDPSSVTPAELEEVKKVFGKQIDSHYSNDLAKRDFARYRHLKRIAIVLGLQGK